MKAKKIVAVVSLAVILAFGIYAVVFASTLPRTYEGKTNVVDLLNDQTNYDVSNPGGVADVIVSENLEKTMAANNVAAVVFDFRGYDTLGESFILLTAIAGSFVILSKAKKHKKEDDK
ncbi:MAG: hypothetical protein IKU65_04435 [Oscillospiraceae bacterium]|nr:hypothetical protein [Oscillospiraceae bacterium]